MITDPHTHLVPSSPLPHTPLMYILAYFSSCLYYPHHQPSVPLIHPTPAIYLHAKLFSSKEPPRHYSPLPLPMLSPLSPIPNPIPLTNAPYMPSESIEYPNSHHHCLVSPFLYRLSLPMLRSLQPPLHLPLLP